MSNQNDLDIARVLETRTATSFVESADAPTYTIQLSDDGLYRSITDDGRTLCISPNETQCQWETENVIIPLMIGTFHHFDQTQRNAIRAKTMHVSQEVIAARAAEAENEPEVLPNNNLDSGTYTGYSNPMPYPTPTPPVQP